MSEIYLYNNIKQNEPKLNVWCAFPADYNLGMSTLGFLHVFKTFDIAEETLAERIFTDTKTTYIQYKYIDLIAFTLCFELNYTGILQILEKYNIPFLAEERDDNYPLIMGGGPVLSANPEPFKKFFDFIIIGDSEPYLSEIIEIIKNNKDKPKKELLEILSKVEGVYVPELNPKTVKKVTAQLDECVTTTILTEKSFFPNTYIIEIERGCPFKCNFCLTSYLNSPVRFCSYEKIIEKIEEGLKYTNKIAFLGALVCSHPKFDDICDYVINKIKSGLQLEVSISSLRANFVSDKTLEMLKLAGQKTATIALEAGSDRLRKIINKCLNREDILNLVDKMVLYGFSGLKIYGIIGLPTETYEDLDEFINICREIKQKHKSFNIIPSFSTFVPKAHTPFQFEMRENTKSLEKKIEYIKKQFALIGIKARTSSAKWDYIQTLLSRGSSDLTQYLIDVYKTGATLGNFKTIYKKYENQQKDTRAAWDFIKF